MRSSAITRPPPTRSASTTRTATRNAARALHRRTWRRAGRVRRIQPIGGDVPSAQVRRPCRRPARAGRGRVLARPSTTILLRDVASSRLSPCGPGARRLGPVNSLPGTRGYTEAMRSWESRLAVADFDPAPFAEAEARTVASGIVIRTYAELAGDPERDRKLYELDCDLCRGCPLARAAHPTQLRVLCRAAARRSRSAAGRPLRGDRCGDRHLRRARPTLAQPGERRPV